MSFQIGNEGGFKKEQKGDMELIYKYFDEGLTGLYKNRKFAGNKNIKSFPVLPEKLLRRYIENEDYIQLLLGYEYVCGYVDFNPNEEYRDFKDEAVNQMKRNGVDPKMITQERKNIIQNWKNTKEYRYMTKINKFGEEEKVYRSFKRPIYVGTTTKLFNQSRQGTFFEKKNVFEWYGETPYLALNTNKQDFIKRITRFGFKDILRILKDIKEEESSGGLDDDFNIVESTQVKTYIENIIEILENPIRQVNDEENEETEKIEEQDYDWGDTDF